MTVQMNAIDRRLTENDKLLVELETLKEQSLNDRYCIFGERLINL